MALFPAPTDSVDVRVKLECARTRMPRGYDPKTIQDFQDGEALCLLVQDLSAGEFTPTDKPKTTAKRKVSTEKPKDKLVDLLKYLRKKGLWEIRERGPADRLDEYEVVDVLEKILLHYLVIKPNQVAAPPLTRRRPSLTRQTSTPDPQSVQMEAKSLLQEAVQPLLPPGAKCTGFRPVEWENRVLFAALINTLSDGELFSDWRDQCPPEDLAYAFDIAASQLSGVHKLLMAEDFHSKTITETAVMLYVSQFIKAKYTPKHHHPGALDLEFTLRRASFMTSEESADSGYVNSPLILPGGPEDMLSGIGSLGPQFFNEKLPESPTGGTLPRRASESRLALLSNEISGSQLPRNVSMNDMASAVQPDWDINLMRSPMKEGWDLLDSTQQDDIAAYFRDPKCLQQLGDEIGSGSYSVVRKCRYNDRARRIHMLVAAKIVLVQGRREEAKQSWRNVFVEVYNMAQFDHPNVVGLISVIVLGSQLCIIQPLLTSDLLSHVTDNKGTLEKADINEKVMDVAVGLQYLSGLEFVHRDIAARNIMIDTEGRAKIGDFGLMRDVLGEYISIGTRQIAFRWAAPELISRDRAREPLTPKSDCWSFGVLYWEVLSWGERPHDQFDNERDLLDWLDAGNRLPQPDTATADEYNLIEQCLQMSAKDRPTFSQVITSLNKILSGDPETTGPLPTKPDTDPVPIKPSDIRVKPIGTPVKPSYLRQHSAESQKKGRPAVAPKPKSAQDYDLPPPPPPPPGYVKGGVKVLPDLPDLSQVARARCRHETA